MPIEPGTPLLWAKQEASAEDAGIAIIGLRLGEDGKPLLTPTNGLVALACQWPTEIDAGDFKRAEANAAYIVAACNAYPELLALVREAREVLQAGVKRADAEADIRVSVLRLAISDALTRLDALLAGEG